MQWLMLQQDKPDDYVVATGKMYSVREFCQKAFAKYDMNYEKYVEIDPRYYRPAEVDQLLGDPTKAMNNLSWDPKVNLDQLVDMMSDHDFDLAKKEHLIRKFT
jgi:GDPmannose 4,6-dehydratase